MNKGLRGRRGPQQLDENEKTRYRLGTPQHLLLEAFRTTKGQLLLVDRILNILGKTTLIQSDKPDFRDLAEQILAMDHQIIEKLRATNKGVSSKIAPPRRVGAMFGPVVELEPVHQPITIEEYYATRSGLDAYTVITLQELVPCFNMTQQDILRIAKMFCDYSRTLFLCLIPELENSYDCKISNAEIRKMLTKIKSWWESSAYTQSECKLFGAVGFFDHTVVVNRHKIDLIPAMIEEILTALNKVKGKITSLKSRHPDNILGNITPINILLHNAGLLYDELLTAVNEMKTLVVGVKMGFSYVCDKIIEDYRLICHEKGGDIISSQEHRRSSLDGLGSPTIGRSKFQSDSLVALNDKSSRRRTTRSNSVKIPSTINSTQKKSVEASEQIEAHGDQGEPKNQVRSLTRSGSLARLFSPRGRAQRLPILFEKQEKTERRKSSSEITLGEIQPEHLLMAQLALLEMEDSEEERPKSPLSMSSGGI